MTQPIDYCRDKVAAPGSNLHYSFMYLPQAQRNRLVAAHAFFAEIQSVLLQVSDPGVARLKLGWWAEELDRLYRAEPRHPVTKALLAAGAETAAVRPHLAGIIAATGDELDHDAHPTFLSQQSACRGAGGRLWQCCAELVGYGDPRVEAYSQTLGCALELSAQIQNFRAHCAVGRTVLPKDDLRAHGLSPDDLHRTESPAPLLVLLGKHLQKIAELFAQAEQLLPEGERLRHSYGLILARIHLKVLDETRRDGYQVTQHQVNLTPLRKYWIASRTYRQELKRHRRLISP